MKNEKEIVKECQRLYTELKLSFREISGVVGIKLPFVIHYCTDLKYKK